MAYKTVGSTLIAWDDNDALAFTMSEATGLADDPRAERLAIDLTRLREGYADDFLLRLKEHFIERRKQVSLTTIRSESRFLLRLMSNVMDIKLFDAKISIIDEAFLLGLGSVKEDMVRGGLDTLRRSFRASPHSPIFARNLRESDFPTIRNLKGKLGSQIDSILATALSQATVAHILDLCDMAYADGRIDIGHYSFAHLAFAVFCRPNSYRQIRLKDFWFDLKQNQYFIAIIRSKTGEHQPGLVTYCINEHLGVLLQKQRQHVVNTYGHLVNKDDIEKLALFPSRKLLAGGLRWQADYPNDNYGRIDNSGHFCRSYPTALKRLLNDDKFTLSANALRHTLGTQLARAGASSQTIKAVLKHASDHVCMAYVDIAFHGMINELSEAMRPAFQDHLPALMRFRSQADPIKPEKAIQSEDMDTSRIVETGECGKDIACVNAPIVCYGCFRFRPCWDADHGVILRIVQQEIDDMSKRGKPFQHMVERAMTAKNRILVVMSAADRYRDAIRLGTNE